MLNRSNASAERGEELVRSDGQCPVFHRDIASDGPADLAALRASLACLIAQCHACSGPEVEFCDDLVAGELALNLQRAVLGIVRELLCNACRHGKSKLVLVGLTRDNDALCVQVQDWGVGFDPQSQGLRQGGLSRVRDMVGCLGGAVRIESQPGTGTCVIVEVALSLARGPRKRPLWAQTEVNGPTDRLGTRRELSGSRKGGSDVRSLISNAKTRSRRT